MRILCLSIKFPHHEIRWNYDIFRSVRDIDLLPLDIDFNQLKSRVIIKKKKKKKKKIKKPQSTNGFYIMVSLFLNGLKNLKIEFPLLTLTFSF